MKDIKNILLIDDDFATNYIHQKLITKVNNEVKIQIAHSGLEALNIINKNTEGNNWEPDLIFLDINMPTMNGWEFLDNYDKLNYEWITECILFMVSSSSNPEDIAMSKTHSRVNGMVNKPLRKEVVLAIFEKYFQSSNLLHESSV